MLDTRHQEAPPPERDVADEASSDGRFSLGSGGDQENAVTIVRLADGKRVFKRKDVCCPDWNR